MIVFFTRQPAIRAPSVHVPRPLLGSRRGLRDSQPTRPRVSAAGGRGRAVDDARTRDCLPSQLGRTTGEQMFTRRGANTQHPGRTANLAPPERPTGASRVGRLPATHRSGRVSGIRPSDRRGPGPAGHRGRNVRSTGRCSYNLRITRRRADSCGLHRSTSQVIRRSGSGVILFREVLRQLREHRDDVARPP